MQEQLIELYTARLAKEKGFFIWSQYRYNTYKDFRLERAPGIYKDLKRDPNQVYAPSQSNLQKWLRENYNIHIHVEPVWNDDLLTVKSYDSHIVTTIVTTNEYIDTEFKTYESALEDALQVALELI